MGLASNNSLCNYILRYVMYTFNLAISFDTIRKDCNTISIDSITNRFISYSKLKSISRIH